MLDAQAFMLMHPHDDHASPMIEVDRPEHPDQDEEREWLHGGRIFRCSECNERVVIGPSSGSKGGDARG